MLKIDGSLKSGSGTILRDATPFALLMGKDLQLINIRAKRDKPGLRPQHLKVVEAVAQVCQGKVKGAGVGSREITFKPGHTIKGGAFHWDIASYEIRVAALTEQNGDTHRSGDHTAWLCTSGPRPDTGKG